MENIITSTMMVIDGYKVLMTFTAENSLEVIDEAKENILKTTSVGVDSMEVLEYNDSEHLDNRITPKTPSSNHSLDESEKGMVEDDG